MYLYLVLVFEVYLFSEIRKIIVAPHLRVPIYQDNDLLYPLFLLDDY